MLLWKGCCRQSYSGRVINATRASGRLGRNAMPQNKEAGDYYDQKLFKVVIEVAMWNKNNLRFRRVHEGAHGRVDPSKIQRKNNSQIAHRMSPKFANKPS